MVPGEKFFSKVLGVEPMIKRMEQHNNPSKNWSYHRPMTVQDYHKQHKKRKTPRPPPYTIQQCEQGPLGPYPPNNRWHNRRPNGFPETCPYGNPLDHHINPGQASDPHRHPGPMWRNEMRGFRDPHQQMIMAHPGAHGHHHHHQHHPMLREDGEYEDEYDEDEDDDDFFINDLSEADMYRHASPQSFVRLPHPYRGRPLPPPHRYPRRGSHPQHGIHPTHLGPYNHQSGHSHLPINHGGYHVPPGFGPYGGYPVPGLGPYDPFQRGHYGGFGGSIDTEVSY